MVARMLSLGIALGFSTLASLGLSPLSAAQAAYPSWSVYAGQVKRPQFRPWYRGEPQSLAGRWRPQMAAPAERRRAQPASRDRTLRQPLFAGGRTWARKAVPVTRGQDLGVRFRPDERVSPYQQTGQPQGGEPLSAEQSQLHSQFRPTRNKRKKTYEELQANNAHRAPAMAPAMPYPMVTAAPLHGYPGYWRGW